MKRISDAQLYAMLTASSEHGAIVEHRGLPLSMGEHPNRIVQEAIKAYFDRPQLLGLARRKFIAKSTAGVWRLTDAGRAHLEASATRYRINEFVVTTTLWQAEIQRKSDSGELDR